MQLIYLACHIAEVVNMQFRHDFFTDASQSHLLHLALHWKQTDCKQPVECMTACLQCR